MLERMKLRCRGVWSAESNEAEEKKQAVMKHYQANYVSVIFGNVKTPECLMRNLEGRYKTKSV